MSDAGLRLEVARSGGFAGITLRAPVDGAALPVEDRKALERLIERPPAPPSRPARPGATRPGADRFQYHLSVTAGGEERSVTIDERDLSPEQRRLLDRLLTRRGGDPGAAGTSGAR